MLEKIPRRIIQTEKSRDLPLLAKAAATNLRLLNPSFEYLFFDDVQVEEFIDDEFPQYRPVFDSFSVKIQRYDLFRYLAVYRLGGFYFDTDVLLASGLEDLIEFSCVGAIIKNCVRAQQHPDWVQPMMKSIPRIFHREFFVLATTGPGLVSRTLAEYPGACDQVKVLFPEDVCDPNSWYCFGAYGVHLQAGTWKKRKGLVPRVVHRLWESTTRKALLKESLKRGPKRLLEFKTS
jgi:mannosyltransferase OCH1-like enzyme